MNKKNELRSECFSIFVNLTKTTLGAGVLAYPYLFKTYGVYYAVLLTVVSALASLFGLWLYIDLNDFYGLDNSMSTIAQYIYPPLQAFVNVAVFFKCFLVCSAYLMLLKREVPGIVRTLLGAQDEYPNLCLFAAVACISPFVFMHRLDKLRYTSSLGVLAILALVLSSVYRFTNSAGAPIQLDTGNRNYLANLGSFVFSFTCHQNIFAAHNEMKIHNKTALKITAMLALGTASVVYIVFGLVNYMTFGDKVARNFLGMLPKDGLGTTVSIFYLLVVMMSIPLQTNPCRAYFLNMFNLRYSVQEKYWHLRAATSLFILLISCMLAAMNSDFECFCGMIGGSFSTFMCFIFAGMYYFLAFRHRGLEIKKLMALFVLVYGGAALLSLLPVFRQE